MNALTPVFHWFHTWTPWVDKKEVARGAVPLNGEMQYVTRRGTKQERRCAICNKVEYRVEWVNFND